jgi:aerotolerance regulator-like protein
VSFLAPLYLLLGGAIAVPLLIHLLRRHIGVKIEFPAARYLARAEQEHSRSLRLRNILLMLLRVAIVLLIATAAARPVARWGTARTGGHGPTALAIVLDNSLSSSVIADGRPLIEQYRAAARDVLAQANSTDRLWLVTADGRVRGGSASFLRDELDRTEPLAGAGDLRLALARASSTVRSAGMDSRQVAVLTDGQRTSWQQQADVGDVQVLVWTPQGAAPSNRAVLSAEARPERWTPRGAVAARLMTRDSTTYRLTLAGRSLLRGTAAPNEEVVVHAAPPERGWVAGTVELEPDELPGDNVRNFAVWIGPAPGVSVSNGAGAFVRPAIDVLRASGRVSEGSDIAIVSADELSTLPALIVAPTDPVRIGAANRALERAGVRWRFGDARRGESSVAGSGRRDAGGVIDSTSLPASRLPPPAQEFADVSATLRYALVPESGAEADTLALVGREPWIVAGPRYVIIASPLVPDATSFPVRAAFVPWLAQMLTERLVGEPGDVINATPGQHLVRPRWADAFEAASGARVTLGDALEAPVQPGTYFLERAGRRVGALVVNPDASESVLDRISGDDVARRITAQRVLVTKQRDEWAGLAFRAAARQSIAEPLLVAGLLLLGVEAVMVGAGRRKAA